MTKNGQLGMVLRISGILITLFVLFGSTIAYVHTIFAKQSTIVKVESSIVKVESEAKSNGLKVESDSKQRDQDIIDYVDKQQKVVKEVLKEIQNSVKLTEGRVWELYKETKRGG